MYIICMKKSVRRNKKLCAKYPFLTYYGDPLYVDYTEENGPDYHFTWEDELSDGWRKAFCPKMWDELKAILEKADYVDKFRFVQIKEKYGQLRLYYEGVPEEIFDEVYAWEEKYLQLSEKVCIECGKPAKYMTVGWISFRCDRCAKDIKNNCIEIKDIDDHYNKLMDEK